MGKKNVDLPIAPNFDDEEHEDITPLNRSLVLSKNKDLNEKLRKKIASPDFLIFAAALYKYTWELDPTCDKHAGAYVILDNKNKLANGTIYVNARKVLNDDYTFCHYGYTIFHELLHIMNKHGSRRGPRDPLMWNLAGDHVINTFLAKVIEYEKEKNRTNYFQPYTTPFIEPDLVKNENNDELSVEEVYEYLQKNFKKNYKIEKVSSDNNQGNNNGGNQQQNTQDNNNSNSGGNNQNSNQKENWYKITDKRTGKSYYVSDKKEDPNCGRAENNTNTTARGWMQKQRGTMPEFMKRYLDKILEVKIPWDELLKSAIKKNVVIRPSDRGWANLNAFYYPIGLTMPGKQYEELPDGIGTLIITVDTSGSISEENLGEFSSVICESIHHFEKIIVLVHDVEIHQYEEFNFDDSAKLFEFITKTGFKGGGGTSHEKIFDVIEEIYEEEQNGVSMNIFLTDGYSDIEENWDKHKWSKENRIPTFIILTKESKFIENIEALEGHQIIMDKD